MSELTALVVDLGGSHADCALVRGDSIVAQQTLRADGADPLAGLLPSIGNVLRQLLKTTGVDSRECSAVVLGFCGIVNAREKRVLATNKKFTDAADLDLSAWCAREFELPFLLENDARLALLGEYAFGAARGAEDAVMVTLGSGVGGATLLGGRLLQSKHGLAGMIGGHLPVTLDGRLCTCGNLGCAEAEASTTTLREIYAQQAGSACGALNSVTKLGFAELFQAADAGDKPALAAVEHCLRIWSVLTVALIHAYDPEVVIFGGSVMKRAADILPRLQQYVADHAWTPGRTVELRAAALGSNAALLGAIPFIQSSL